MLNSFFKMRNNNFSYSLNLKISFIYLNVLLGLYINLGAGNPRKIESLLDVVQPVQGVCAPSVPESCDFDSIFYSINGACNNPQYPTAGQAGTPYARILPALYSDDYYQDRLGGDDQPLPLPRLLRTTLLPDDFKPTNFINIMFEGLGQFISHDTTRTRVDFSDSQLVCCANKAPVLPIPDKCRLLIIPPDDPFYSQYGVTCVAGRRLISTRTLGCGAKPVLMINYQSSWLDLSILYSADENLAKEIRANEGGLLKVKNDADTNNQDFPPTTSGNQNCPFGGLTPQPGGNCLLGGDSRINQNIELLIPDVLLWKYHNFVATALKEINQQKWNNDDLYFHARRITTAVYQNLISSEYISLLIGQSMSEFYDLLPKTEGYSNCYNPKLNPQTFHSFAAAASRVSHSTINGVFTYTGPQGQQEQYKLHEKLFNLEFIFQKDGFLNMVKALTSQSCDTQDQFFSEEVTEHLFETTDAGTGSDLPAADTNRGRENGFQGYNAFRVICGYNKLESWDDFSSILALPEYVEKLKNLYFSVDDVELYVALALEKPLDGTLGEVGACIVGAQFHHYKCADRLWYEFESAKFSIEQLNSIRSTTLSSVICSAMPEIGEIPQFSLRIQSSDNPVIPCDETPKIDLNLWKVPQ